MRESECETWLEMLIRDVHLQNQMFLTNTTPAPMPCHTHPPFRISSSKNLSLTNTNHPSLVTQVRLIAVSKLKPLNDILALHRSEHRQLDFGENYFQELQQKAELYSQLEDSRCKLSSHLHHYHHRPEQEHD